MIFFLEKYMDSKYIGWVAHELFLGQKKKFFFHFPEEKKTLFSILSECVTPKLFHGKNTVTFPQKH